MECAIRDSVEVMAPVSVTLVTRASIASLECAMEAIAASSRRVTTMSR